jgi:hypothetical protein
MTPEGKIKRRISQILKEHAPELFYNMPVPGGYGEPILDYVGCLRGFFFAIEAKKPDGVPTPRQTQMISRLRTAGAKVFIIDGEEGYQQLREWIWSLT